MSCSFCGTISGCGCSQPPACNYNVVVNNGSSGTVNGAANANIAGVGVFDAQDNGVLYFRGIESADATYLSVSLNATNHTILLTFNVNAFAAALPQATTSQAGIGETATNAEAQAKASTTVFLTPSNLAALGSSDTFAGLVELATDAETQTGTSTTLAVTPAGLKSVTDLLGTTVTFADSVTRAAATPSFAGEFSVQIDTSIPYISSGTTVGDFDLPLLVLGSGNNLAPGDTVVDLGINNLFVQSSGGVCEFACDSSFTQALQATGNLELYTTTRWVIDNILIPVNSVLVTSATAGQPESKPINEFISTDNTQTGWSVTNPSVSRTLDVSAASLADVRAVLGTLINDLKSVKLPAT